MQAEKRWAVVLGSFRSGSYSSRRPHLVHFHTGGRRLAVEKDGMFWMAVVDADPGALRKHLVPFAGSRDQANRWIVHSPTFNFDREAHAVTKERT